MSFAGTATRVAAAAGLVAVAAMVGCGGGSPEAQTPDGPDIPAPGDPAGNTGPASGNPSEPGADGVNAPPSPGTDPGRTPTMSTSGVGGSTEPLTDP